MVCIVFVFCAATAIASPAQVLNTLYSFCAQSNCADGSLPWAGLVQAADGNFYGTTADAGANGWGTVFKITPSGALTTLYSFCAQSNCADGSSPYAGLVQATDGNFYGTAFEGGNSYSSCGLYGTCGTVFKITPSGALTTLYSFCSQSGCTDGANPIGGLVQGRDGNFYGTTFSGGSYCPPDGCGTVFKITPSGTLTTLHSFEGNGTGGGGPVAALVQATDGNFYGTTGITVFKITPGGTLTTLHTFYGADGAQPYAGLVQASDGNFYGTTLYGGANGGCNYGEGCGTVFKITPSGTLTTLHSFCSQPNCTDGDSPHAGLVQATDGDLYGTTSAGGNASNEGTVFKITAGGTLTTVYSFHGTPDPGIPYAGLVQAADENFYGTTFEDGAHDGGSVFRLVSVRPCFSCPLQWK